MNTLIICGSRYGATRVIAGWIAERLGYECLIVDVKEAPDLHEFDLIIIGSGIYEERPMPEILNYIDKHIKILEEKKKVIFGVCLDTSGFFVRGKIHGGWEYVRPVIEKFQDPPLHAGVLHGEINPSKLTTDDEKRLMIFYNKMLKRNYAAIPFRTKMNKEEVWEFAERILSKLGGKFY